MSGNRQARRAGDAQRRQQAPSVALLRKRIEDLEQESGQMRNVLFAILKEQGRVRFSKRTLESLGQDDGLQAEDIGEHYIVTFVSRGQQEPKGVA